MKIQGHIKDMSIDWSSGKTVLSFVTSASKDLVEQAFLDCYGSLLDIEFDTHKDKRSKDANSYAWVLMSKLAEKLHTSKDEVYEQMLSDCEYFEEDEHGDPVTITINEIVDISIFQGHWKFVGYVGEGFVQYVMLRGSSTYNTKEMARLINDFIIPECKAQGIETMTPAELENLISQWRPR